MLKTEEIENVKNGVIYFPTNSRLNKNPFSNTLMRGAVTNISIYPAAVVRSKSSLA